MPKVLTIEAVRTLQSRFAAYQKAHGPYGAYASRGREFATEYGLSYGQVIDLMNDHNVYRILADVEDEFIDHHDDLLD